MVAPLGQVRPTLQWNLDPSAGDEELWDSIRTRLAQNPDRYAGAVKQRHALLYICDERRKFWSPWLNLELRTEDGRRQLFGRFSPHPSIWTFFMFAYLSVGVLVFFAVIYGIAQQSMGEPPWAYLLVVPGALAILVLWSVARIGQKMAQSEMTEMQQSIEEWIQLKTDLEST